MKIMGAVGTLESLQKWVREGNLEIAPQIEPNRLPHMPFWRSRNPKCCKIQKRQCCIVVLYLEQ